MTQAGAKLIEAAQEAVSIAKGEQPAARIHVNGFAYVPDDRWRTMETAPRDGSFVLLYNRAHEETWVLGWTPNSAIFEDDPEEGGMWTDAGGRNVSANVCYNDGGYFSFWMPLPPPPITTRKD